MILKEAGALAEGDTAVFDFSGSVDGVKFDGGTAENYELKIGSGQFIPGFEAQMIGMNVEESKDLRSPSRRTIRKRRSPARKPSSPSNCMRSSNASSPPSPKTS
ncbi:MAG: FKBP-type peptidyl-prolyl cis-trans isomerase [Bacillus subtilis]|nr:FKBP-type peptidyl-prolyl cis-trans isomerase [Bacillus subtilis]